MTENPTPKTTLILGASTNPERYAYKAANLLHTYGHPIWLVGLKDGVVAGAPIHTFSDTVPPIDTLTLYMNPARQQSYYDYILSLAPRRIIFNPGTENPELEQLAEAKGIQTVEACTLVLLHTGQYESA